MSKNPSPKKSYNKHKVIAGALLVVAGVSIHTRAQSACGCDWGYSIGTVAGKFISGMVSTATTQNIAGKAISAAAYLNSQRIISAYSIHAKSKAVAAQTMSKAIVDAQETFAHAISAIEAQQRTTQAAIDHSAEFGQGFQPCRVLSQQGQIADAMQGMPARIAKDVTKTSASPGRRAPREAEREAIDNANKFYCAPGWEQLICSAPSDKSLQGASIKASTIFKPSKEGDDLSGAKDAFANNLAGTATKAMNKSAEKTVEGETVNMLQLGVHARTSPAQVSIAAIIADTTSRNDGHSDDPDNLSLDERFEREAMRYMGAGEDSLEWARVMAQQEKHGLLIELLKTKALDLALMERQYRQYERMEAVLAALVAQAGQAAAAEVDAIGTYSNVSNAQ
ncbi:MAG: hypothetical protein IKZ87_04275 [Actinomycetaceae bacterium]|nr:hypothetical protein [Actinomycetaceae bacterium]